MKQVKLVIALVLFTIGSLYSQSSYNQKLNLCDTCNLSGPRWGNAVTLPGQYHAGTDTNFVIFYRDTFGGGIGYGIAVKGDTSLYFLDYDSTAMDWVVKWRSSTFFDINKQLQIGALGNPTFGVRLKNTINAASLATDANGKIIAGSLPTPIAIYHLTYAQASDTVSKGKVVPNAWYHITNKDIYIQGVTDSTYSLNGYYVDSTIWEVDAIQFDFANAHIQQRCDKRGNCVGAAFGIVDNGFISVDPILVFAWGDDFIVGNTVKDAVFDLTNIVGVGDAIVALNSIIQQSEVVVGNNGSLEFQKNIVESGATWTSLFSTGIIIENTFTNGIDVNTDSTNTLTQQNNMYGQNSYFRINRSSGNFLANDGQGHIQSRYSVNCNIRDNNFFNGAYIFADSLRSDINANELHRGSELHMISSDSAFSKNYLDFTAIVKANNTQNRTEYNRFIGGGNGFGTVFIAVMSTSGKLISTHVVSAGDSVIFNPNTVYNGNKIEFTGNLGIGTLIPTEALHVVGSVKIVDGTQGAGKVFTDVTGSGKGAWQDHTGYGEMGFGDSTRTIALTQNVFSVVTNSNKTLWSTAAIDLHNVTYSGDSLIIDSAGTYQVNIQLSMDGTSGSVIRLGVFLNGVLACSCTGYQELLNNRILQLSYINIDALNAGDVLQVVITNTANGNDVDAIGGKLMVNKIK